MSVPLQSRLVSDMLSSMTAKKIEDLLTPWMSPLEDLGRTIERDAGKAADATQSVLEAALDALDVLDDGAAALDVAEAIVPCPVHGTFACPCVGSIPRR